VKCILLWSPLRWFRNSVTFVNHLIVPKCWQLNCRRSWITQKKEYDIQYTAKVLKLRNIMFIRVEHFSWWTKSATMTSMYEKGNKEFFPSNATTCPLWTSWSPLPVVA
jgi:hypothetical protein